MTVAPSIAESLGTPWSAAVTGEASPFDSTERDRFGHGKAG